MLQGGQAALSHGSIASCTGGPSHPQPWEHRLLYRGGRTALSPGSILAMLCSSQYLFVCLFPARWCCRRSAIICTIVFLVFFEPTFVYVFEPTFVYVFEPTLVMFLSPHLFMFLSPHLFMFLSPHLFMFAAHADAPPQGQLCMLGRLHERTMWVVTL